jgi:hypothetical protein
LLGVATVLATWALGRGGGLAVGLVTALNGVLIFFEAELLAMLTRTPLLPPTLAGLGWLVWRRQPRGGRGGGMTGREARRSLPPAAPA